METPKHSVESQINLDSQKVLPTGMVYTDQDKRSELELIASIKSIKKGEEELAVSSDAIQNFLNGLGQDEYNVLDTVCAWLVSIREYQDLLKGLGQEEKPQSSKKP